MKIVEKCAPKRETITAADTRVGRVYTCRNWGRHRYLLMRIWTADSKTMRFVCLGSLDGVDRRGLLTQPGQTFRADRPDFGEFIEVCNAEIHIEENV